MSCSWSNARNHSNEIQGRIFCYDSKRNKNQQEGESSASINPWKLWGSTIRYEISLSVVFVVIFFTSFLWARFPQLQAVESVEFRSSSPFYLPTWIGWIDSFEILKFEMDHDKWASRVHKEAQVLGNTGFEKESCIFFACWDHTIDMSLPAP